MKLSFKLPYNSLTTLKATHNKESEFSWELHHNHHQSFFLSFSEVFVSRQHRHAEGVVHLLLFLCLWPSCDTTSPGFPVLSVWVSIGLFPCWNLASIPQRQEMLSLLSIHFSWALGGGLCSHLADTSFSADTFPPPPTRAQLVDRQLSVWIKENRTHTVLRVTTTTVLTPSPVSPPLI